MENVKKALAILIGLRENVDEGEYVRGEIESAIHFLEKKEDNAVRKF